jgi:hypothetical protein
MSKAREAFEQNRADIDQLLEIHSKYAGRGVGLKHGVEVLNRAGIVFITACWESYVEDMAKEMFDLLLREATSPSMIPMKVRELATRPIFDQKDSRKIWDLADTGWRSVLVAHREAVMKRWLDPFNTPKTEQVKALYADLLGIPDISSSWRWKGSTPKKASDRLDEYITVRGNIAHRTKHDETVYKDWIYDYSALVHRLIDATELRLYNHFKALLGKPPF